jgi:hypothetical protein
VTPLLCPSKGVRLRSRNRNIFFSTNETLKRTHTDYTDPGGEFWGSFTDELVYPPCMVVEETCQDDLGYGRQQRCNHSKATFRTSGVGGWTHVFTFSGLKRFVVHEAPNDVWISNQIGTGALSSIASIGEEDVWPSMDIDRLAASFYEKLRFSKDGFYGLEFAKDMLHTVNSARQFWKPGAIKNVSNILRRHRLSLKSPLGAVMRALKSTSDGYLAWTFGVKPMVKDFRICQDAYGSYRKRIDEFLNAAKKGNVISVHSRYSTSKSFNSEVEPLPYPHDGTICKKLTSCRYDFVMSGKAHLRPDAATRSFAEFTASRLRLDDVFGIAWELIPYSFVADWFFRIGDRIHAFQHDQILKYGPFSSITDWNLSRKRTAIYEVFINPSGWSGFGIQDSPKFWSAGSIKTTTYQRNLNFDGDILAGYISRLGSFQFITGGALLLQKLL